MIRSAGKIRTLQGQVGAVQGVEVCRNVGWKIAGFLVRPGKGIRFKNGSLDWSLTVQSYVSHGQLGYFILRSGLMVYVEGEP